MQNGPWHQIFLFPHESIKALKIGGLQISTRILFFPVVCKCFKIISMKVNFVKFFLNVYSFLFSLMINIQTCSEIGFWEIWKLKEICWQILESKTLSIILIERKRKINWSNSNLYIRKFFYSLMTQYSYEMIFKREYSII